jgi:hypothetical protein
VRAAGCTKPGWCVMWFLAILAGIVFVIAAALLAGRARRAGRPALVGFAESASLPVLGASGFIALGLAAHDTAWTLAWVVLTYAAGMAISSVAGLLAGRARRAGHPALVSFTHSASLPVSAACFWFALGLARHHVDWTTPAVFLLACGVWAVPRTLRQRRNNAPPSPLDR